MVVLPLAEWPNGLGQEEQQHSLKGLLLWLQKQNLRWDSSLGPHINS